MFRCVERLALVCGRRVRYLIAKWPSLNFCIRFELNRIAGPNILLAKSMMMWWSMHSTIMASASTVDGTFGAGYTLATGKAFNLLLSTLNLWDRLLMPTLLVLRRLLQLISSAISAKMHRFVLCFVIEINCGVSQHCDCVRARLNALQILYFFFCCSRIHCCRVQLGVGTTHYTIHTIIHTNYRASGYFECSFFATHIVHHYFLFRALCPLDGCKFLLFIYLFFSRIWVVIWKQVFSYLKMAIDVCVFVYFRLCDREHHIAWNAIHNSEKPTLWYYVV